MCFSPGASSASQTRTPDNSPATTRYGKLNFVNRGDKDIKIFEVSGIGEPTVLSPNYVSTFFIKSPKESATFRAVDPTTNEAFLLNGLTTFEVKLDQNPEKQTEVQITKPVSNKRFSTKRRK